MGANGCFIASYIFPDAAGGIVIDAEIKNRKSKECRSVTAMVDTGAERSCVSKRLAKELGLASEKNRKAAFRYRD